MPKKHRPSRGCVSVSEAAKMLGLTVCTVRRMCDRGELLSFRETITKTRRVFFDSIKAFVIDRRRQQRLAKQAAKEINRCLASLELLRNQPELRPSLVLRRNRSIERIFKAKQLGGPRAGSAKARPA